MWVFLKNSFLSVVQSPDNPAILVVRARVRGDIEAVFPVATIEETPYRDYRFRTYLRREEVAQALYSEVWNLTATNFKNSVDNKDRHDAYLDVWSAMYMYQQRELEKETGESIYGYGV